MKRNSFFCIARYTSFFLLLLFYTNSFVKAQCDPLTPTFTLDLSGSPNATSVTPSAVRNGTCCTGTDPCVKIVVILNPNSMALLLQVIGANPGGALNYEFDCDGVLYPGGTPLCLSGTGTHTLTACKVGGNSNSYSVTAVPKPSVPDSIFVRNGCTQTLSATGFSVPTITWSAINGGTNTALFNSYLNCTVGCATVTVTPSGIVPVPFIDYLVSGFGAAPCGTNFYQDTVRVFFYNNLSAPLSPTTICFGSVSAALNPTPSGGKPAYSYSWSTGSTNQNITVGAGNYTLTLFDQTGCPPITSTVTVSQFTLPITAYAGIDQTVCKIPSPTVSLSGSIGIATGGIWSGGNGTFTPSANLLTTSYIPSPTEVATGSVQLLLTSTGNFGCPPGTDSVTLTFQTPPSVNAGPNQTVCANNNLVNLSGSISGFSATALWSSSGTGSFSSLTNYTTSYSPSAADVSNNMVDIILVSTNNGVCPSSKDTMRVFISPKPLVNAGTDQLICSINSAILSGSVSGATSTGSWSTSGDGSFSPGNTVLTASYVLGPNDINTGTVSIFLTSTNNGNCLLVRDTMKITIRKIAVVNAGINQMLCSNTSSIVLSGSVTGGTTTGTWSSNGTGIFVPNNLSVATSYSPSLADVTAGSVIFTLTSANNGPCPAISDTVKMVFRTIANVNAGVNQSICSTQPSISLQGTVSAPSNSGSWASSGAGAFIPNNTALSPVYSVTTSDINNGFVTFSLSSSNNGVCPVVTDTVRMRIVKQATINAGVNQSLCSTTPSIVLSGSVNGGSGSVNWSVNGGGTFNPATTSLSTVYSILPADVLTGSLVFTLASTNNGPCALAMDTVKILLRSPASVNSGSNQSLCSSQPTISLTGTVNSFSNTAIWTSSGTGSFVPNNTVLNTSYSLTPADINNGFVTFSLTSTNNGACPAVTDTVRMRIIKQATVNAGLNQKICSTNPVIILNGTVTGGTSNGSWAVNGIGPFNPGNLFLSTTYSLTPSDILAGSLIFTLSSQNNGPCAQIMDTVKIVITTSATVNAGNNQSICSTQNTVQLSGLILGTAATGSWSASGGGSFVPGNTNLVTAYSITPADVVQGSVIFTLTSTNNGICPIVRDTVKIKITKLASVTAGSDQSICSTQAGIALSGTLSGGGNAGIWSSSGTGNFSPAPNQLNTIYSIAPGDISNGNVQFVLSSLNSSPCPEITDTLNVIIKTPATVYAGNNQVICSTTKLIVLNGQVNGGGASGVWTSGGGGVFLSSNTNLVNSYSVTLGDIAAGQVIFTLTSTNNGACPAVSDTVKVAVKLMATVNAGPDMLICSNQTMVFLNGSVFGNTTTGSWQTSGNGTFVPNANFVNSTYSLGTSDVNATTILMVLFSTNNGICPAGTDTMRISIIKKPVINLKLDTTVCEKQNPVKIIPQFTGGSGIVQWTTSGTGSFVPDNTSIPVSYMFTESDVNTGSVTIGFNSVNNGPCGNIGANMKLNMLPSARAIFLASSYLVTIPSDPIIFTNQSTNASTYKWDFGDGVQSNNGNPSHNYNTVGFYTVTLIANNKYNCSDTLRKEMTVISDIKFPNAFTPNPSGPNGGSYSIKDLNNDVFFPYTSGVTDYDLMIFNRWGELLFRSTDISIGWDGYFNGKLCQQDAYVWKASVKFFDGRTYNKTGSVTLLR